MSIDELIEKLRSYCECGYRASSEETLRLIGEIDRLRAELERIAEICSANGGPDVEYRMALAFVGDVARDALSPRHAVSPHQDGGAA